MKSFNFMNTEIKYIEQGEGSPIIFLHNGGNDHHIWDYQIECFSKDYRVFAVDNPGYGMSGTPDANLTLELYADFLHEFISHHKLDSVILVGNCLGSAMSLRYTMLHSEKVKSLILYNVLTEKTLLEGQFGFLPKFSSASDRFTRVFSFIAKKLVVPKLFRGIVFRSQYGKGHKPDLEFKEHLNRCYSNSGQLDALYDLVKDIDSFGLLDKSSFDFPPICVIWGGENRILSPGAGERLCDNLKSDEFHLIQEAGHMVMREQYEKVNLIMKNFIIK